MLLFPPKTLCLMDLRLGMEMPAIIFQMTTGALEEVYMQKIPLLLFRIVFLLVINLINEVEQYLSKM